MTTTKTRTKSTALALAVAAVLVLFPGATRAQEIAGRITGQVTDEATHRPLGGVTVIVQGPQGEDATLTDDTGVYNLANLPVGRYTIRFYTANIAVKVERPNVDVSAGTTTRADAAIPSEARVEETYVIKKKAPPIDVGSTRIGLTVGPDYINNVPLERTFGDVTEKAPGAFPEASGGVSIAGASGLENIYFLDGLNVTGMEYGDITNRRSDGFGGSNLTLDFVQEMQINTGGYRAEFGGAMGGVINVITKSGSNEFHGSAFSYLAPFWLSADPMRIQRTGVALVGTDKPDYDLNVGFEVGGPIIRNKLFFWAGFAPRLERSHFFRDTLALSDADGDGAADIDPATGEASRELVQRIRTNQLRQSYQLGGKLDLLVNPDNQVSLGIFSTPSASRHVRSLGGQEAVNDPRWAQQGIHKTNTDVILNVVSKVLDRRLKIEGSIGLHRESFTEQSPYDELNAINQIEWHNASLYKLEGIDGCAPMGSFDRCPVDVYTTGGYGQIKSFTGNRWMADLKLTNLLGKHELKYGGRAELNYFDQTRNYSGPAGEHRLLQVFPDGVNAWNFFTLPRGKYPFQFADAAPGNFDPNNDGSQTDLVTGPYYRDALPANVKSINSAAFIQDTFRVLPNLILDAGVRYESQKLYDYRGDQFLSLNNWGPRVGFVYDPSNEGRSKVYGHYGDFFETIPMNLAARYFGGEGIAIGNYPRVDPMTGADVCVPPPEAWRGTGGEWRGCPSANGYSLFNNGSNYPVQPHITGQHHHEVLGGFRHALTEDLVVGVDYTHRWLGAVIEDGTTADGTYVLGNPGAVPDEAIKDLEKQIADKQAEVNNAMTAPERAVAQQQLGSLQSTLANVQGLGKLPKPERTYDAITLSASKRLARSWMLQASYTYSRLIGNYNGLFDADTNYFAPNGSSAFDYPELTVNHNGPLANDRPHSGRVDAFYQARIGKGTLVSGISFAAFSGVPRNYISQFAFGAQAIFLLPRGSAGRTPTVTQTDVKLAYRYELPTKRAMSMELFLDLFNIFNELTALRVDENYTFDQSAPIVNGSVADLKYAKNSAGGPVAVNPNFGKPTAFQSPFHGRFGLRLMF